MTDEQLFNLCKKYGENAIFWRRKFAGLLPEVFKRRLYEKKGYCSIFEFAAKLAGMSQEQVRLVLNLEKKFEDKPDLQKLLLDGKVSANKLVRIAAIATAENQESLAEKVRIFSQKAVETYVRDLKLDSCGTNACGEKGYGAESKAEDNNGLQEPLFEGESLRAQIKTSPISEIVKLKLDEDILKELLNLQEKNIDINNLIRKMLKNRETEIVRAKEELAEEMRRNYEQKKQTVEAVKNAGKVSRYIPAKIRKIIDEEQGEKCSIPGCCKKAEVTHHELPFAITKNHDPNYLKKLCKAHHEIAHMVNIKFYKYTRSKAGVPIIKRRAIFGG
jgi:hypothetical protein